MGSGSKINNTGGIAALVQDAAKIALQRQVNLFDESEEESLDREITREEQRGVPQTKLGKDHMTAFLTSGSNYLC
ncbi:hypothetical protein DPMN_000948 [Dreissena polymorpha]|uniref:Uncharacterized protein n=1 Tax=Dreissena polymorpha TaxID=45954 RepID=A0A9D4MKR9_DREPO|nr:hypothetical protein DPMN_000948 [Dreissena polymorpha]